MGELESFVKELAGKKRIVITTHSKPDADALGSSLGLAGYLKKKGHDVNVITPTDYPQFLCWMQGNDEVIIFNHAGNEERSAQLVAKADMIFCLDFSALGRINDLGEFVRKSKATKVLIDHHLDPEDFAKYSFWSTKAAATAELVYDLIDSIGDRDQIDKGLAEALYAGIMTDTGQFKHPNTTKNVHRIVGELIELGADVSAVASRIYDNNSEKRLRFLGYALSEKLVVIPELHTAYIAISAQELTRFNSKTGDTEGIVNYALSIKGITVAAVIIDRTEAIKMSFRSHGDFSVNDFARNYFEGGGHKNAAGGISYLSLEETVKKFEKHLRTHKNELSN